MIQKVRAGLRTLSFLSIGDASFEVLLRNYTAALTAASFLSYFDFFLKPLEERSVQYDIEMLIQSSIHPVLDRAACTEGDLTVFYACLIQRNITRTLLL